MTAAQEARERAAHKSTSRLCAEWEQYSELFAINGYIDAAARAGIDELVARVGTFTMPTAE